MSETHETTVKILPFSGKKKDWHKWLRQFLAFGARRGYKQVVTGTLPVPTLMTSSSTEDKRVNNLNNNAYADLILSMSDDVAFGIVDRAGGNSAKEKVRSPDID